MRWVGENRDILLIALAALVLRLAAVVPLHEDGYTSDEKEYVALATTLSQGEPFVDSNADWSTKAPLWPFLLSVVFRVFGYGLLLPHVLNCLVGTLIVIMGFTLFVEAIGDRQAALAAAAVMALYPGLIVYAGVLQTETVYIALFLATFIWWGRAKNTLSLRDGILLGIFAGLSSLTRAVFVAFFPVMVFSLLWQNRRTIRTVVPVAGMAIIVWLAVLAPWTIRNFHVHGAIVPVSTWGGISLLLGNNPYATGTWSTKPGFDEWLSTRAEHHGVLLQQATEVERSNVARELAFEFMRENPDDALKLAAKKLYMYAVYPISNSDSNSTLQAICVAGDILLYSLAGMGIVVMGHFRRERAVWFVVILFFTLLHVLMHVEARYRLPIMPFIAFFAGSGMAVALDTERRKKFFDIQRNRLVVGMWLILLAVVYGLTAWQFVSGNI